MLLGKESRLRPSFIMGIFNDARQAYAAQSLLTDFHYPRESIKTVALDERCIIRNSDRKVVEKMRKSAIKNILVGAIMGMIIGATVGAGFCLLTGSLAPEGNEEISGMIIFLLVEAAIGCFFGALIWTAIQSRKTQKSTTRFQKSVLRGKILISVAPRTNEDAVDIAREWKNIGDHLLQH